MINIGNIIIQILIAYILQITSESHESNSTMVRNTRAIIELTSKKWPNGVIPYIIDYQEFFGNELDDLNYAIETWNRDTCINFKHYGSGDTNWLQITGGRSCYTHHIGFANVGEHIINLARGRCRFFGVYLHELGHAIGLAHEQKRYDRDYYITINYHSIPQQIMSEFARGNQENQQTYGTPYDTDSIMHYGEEMNFGRGQVTVMSNNDRQKPLKGPYLKDLSFYDIKTVNEHYQCSRHCGSSHVSCPSPGFIDKNCVCQTPEKFMKNRCKNRLDDYECKQRALGNGCTNQLALMVGKCRKACKFCNGVEDSSEDSTRRRTEDESNRRRTEDESNSRKDCTDKSSDCEDWSNLGYCTMHRETMTEYCSKTCKFCS